MSFAELIKDLPLIFTTLFVAILFIQSGLDKVFDYKGNLEWLTGHFAKSPLGGTIPFMLPVLTAMEILSGVLSAIGLIYFLVTGVSGLIFYASIAAAASLTALFFGQRVAKDYPGAAILVPYFLLVVVMMYLSLPK